MTGFTLIKLTDLVHRIPFPFLLLLEIILRKTVFYLDWVAKVSSFMVSVHSAAMLMTILVG